MNVDAPNSFLTAASLYFVFGLAAFGWIQQERVPLPLAQTLFALVVGRHLFHRADDVRRRTTGAPLPILLFPQLAASGWLLRTQTAFFHAALAAIVLLEPRGLSRARRRHPRSAALPDRAHRLRLFRDGRHRRRTRPLYEGVGGAGRAARHRRRQPRAGQPPDHPGHAGRRARRRPQRRRARPQRAGDAAARRLRTDARRHAPRGVLDDAARLLAAVERGSVASRCRRSRSRRRSGCCACASCASARGSTAAR